MMFSAETNIFRIAQKQFYFKLKGNLGLFSSMIALQGVALLLSLRGTGQMSMGSNEIKLSVHYLSNDLLVIFTTGWAFYAAIMLTTRTYRDFDFSLVSNRITSSLANIAFLLGVSIIGGLTSMLTGILLRVINYFTVGSSSIIGQEFFISPLEMLIGITAAALYVLLVSALGYLVGMLVQVSLLFSPLFIALGFGGLRSGILQTVTGFFINEGSFLLFALKVSTTALLFFALATVFANRLEVRKP